MDDNKILFVDLDGTLIKEDLSHLAFFNFLKRYHGKTLYHIIIFMFKGKTYLKEKISLDFKVPFQKLSFNQAAINYVREVKNRHRVVYMISGSHQCLVDQMDAYFKIFFESFGTSQNFNMVGKNKIKYITSTLKIHEFDYLGNSKKDLPIWMFCKRIIYTNASENLKKIINVIKLDKIEIKEKFK